MEVRNKRHSHAIAGWQDLYGGLAVFGKYSIDMVPFQNLNVRTGNLCSERLAEDYPPEFMSSELAKREYCRPTDLWPPTMNKHTSSWKPVEMGADERLRKRRLVWCDDADSLVRIGRHNASASSREP
jgi:hypothetical protein